MREISRLGSTDRVGLDGEGNLATKGAKLVLNTGGDEAVLTSPGVQSLAALPAMVAAERAVFPQRTVLIGDSLMANGGAVPNMDLRNFVYWGSCLAGAPLEVVGNVGVAGYKTAQALVTVPAAIATGANSADVMVGTNDIGDLDFDGSSANLASIYLALRNAGVYVRAYTILPRALTVAGQLGILHRLNNFIREYWRARTGGECIDAFTAVATPTFTSASSGAMSTAYSPDTVHLNNYGAYVVGRDALAPALVRRGSLPPLLPSQASDDPAYSTRASALTNPLFAGSGGSATGTATGTVATGWTVNANATAAVASVAARSDGYGNNQVVAATTDTAHRFVTVVSSDAKANMVAGRQYVGVGEFNIDANPAHVSSVEFGVIGVSDGSTRIASSIDNTGAAQALVITANTKLTLRTPVFTEVSGATFRGIWIRVWFRAVGGAATFALGRCAIYEVPTIPA